MSAIKSARQRSSVHVVFKQIEAAPGVERLAGIILSHSDRVDISSSSPDTGPDLSSAEGKAS